MLNIYIDESGSFVPATAAGSWSLCAALVIPNPYERKCNEALRRLKIKSGFKHNEEIKLKNVSENDYLQFLLDLSETGCTLYAVATDSGAQSANEIREHRDNQADKLDELRDKMIYTDGKKSIEIIANQVRALSEQLHLQLVCQVELIADVIDKSILYYVQRLPSQLNGFCWRIDEKTSAASNFEKTFRTLIPPILQTKSLKNPNIHVIDFDYSAMNDFFYSKENAPTYLKDYYKIESNLEGALNVGKLIWDDFKFVNSKEEIGVQLVDLLASGLRRVLRGSFSTVISSALSSLLVQTIHHGYPIQLITVSKTKTFADETADKVLQLLKSNQKPMLI